MGDDRLFLAFSLVVAKEPSERDRYAFPQEGEQSESAIWGWVCHLHGRWCARIWVRREDDLALFTCPQDRGWNGRCNAG